jgi:hypothetical protein
MIGRAKADRDDWMNTFATALRLAYAAVSLGMVTS